jgi:hypothetical protein
MGVDTTKIITSQDANIKEMQKELQIKPGGVPAGFVKWQLPFFLTRESLNYFSYGAPNAEVPEHSHEEGEQLRVIMHGSISCGGKVLQQGDWMYVPAGKKYSFTVGEQGVGMFYCYCCYCWTAA